MLRDNVKKHTSLPKHVSRAPPYRERMKKKRPRTEETLVVNLNQLMEATGWSNRELGKRAKVSDRYIGMIRRGEHKPTNDIAEALAKPFGLTGWQLILPGLRADLAKSGALERLIKNYQNANADARQYIDSVAEREAHYGPGEGPKNGTDSMP